MIFSFKEKSRDFLNEVEGMLLEHESLNNLMLGIAERLCSMNPDEGEPFFIVIKNKEGTLLGAAMRSAPIRPLILTEMSEALIRSLVSELVQKNIKLKGVVGHIETAKKFAELWSEPSKVGMDQGVYECKELIPPREIKGKLVQVEPTDLKAIEAACLFGGGFIKDCFPEHKEPMEEARRAIERYAVLGVIYLWQDEEGQFVSMAANHRESKNAGTIGWVYTPPEKRGHGFGTMVTHGVSQEIFKKGKALANLYTDMSNPTSNSIYQHIGYQLIGRSAHIDFEDSSHQS